LKVSFLGTGTSQGVPVIACNCKVCSSKDKHNHRLRSSILIEHHEQHIVIDTGPDFRYQMLRASVQKLDAVLYTHSHKDHIAGLDDIRAFNRKQGKSIDIYAETNVQEALKREFFYAFDPKAYFGVPQLKLHTIQENERFNVGLLSVLPVRVLHYKMPVLGFRFGDFTYVTDAKTIDEETIKLLKGTKVLVLNALQLEDHISHMTLQEAIEMAKRIGAEKTYLTHISHFLGLHDEVSSELPPNVFLAYDGLTLDI
jgi:phosphoribosyl 1,2-cyclic phosphate phosphodiesterase